VPDESYQSLYLILGQYCAKCRHRVSTIGDGRYEQALRPGILEIVPAEVGQIRKLHDSAAVLAMADRAVVVKELGYGEVRGHAVLGEMVGISRELAKDREQCNQCNLYEEMGSH